MCVGAMVREGGGEVVGVGVGMGVGEGERLEEVGGAGEGREGWKGVSCMLSCPPVGWLCNKEFYRGCGCDTYAY